jgi:glycosyltransferase involved in cell wall biosynthesis
MTQKCVALLGRRDTPTDAVEEYCRFLGAALTQYGYEMEIARVSWAERGWNAALSELKRDSRNWRDARVLLQYTALAWSQRGFPSRVLRVMDILREAGAHLGMVFHDGEPFAGARLVDRLRRQSQLRVMHEALRRADPAIFTVALDRISWRTKEEFARATFIPVGANLPEPAIPPARPAANALDNRWLTIGVYGVTGGASGQAEIQTIVAGVRFAAEQLANLRLVIVGRNSEAVEQDFRRALWGTAIDLRVLGVLPAAEIANVLGETDVLLFVRGEISTRRGSAIAGIACGLPVVTFAGRETAPPITEAGLALYAPDKPNDFSRVLLKVLADPEYRAALASRSRAAQQQYFSWNAIAAQFAKVLGKP